MYKKQKKLQELDEKYTNIQVKNIVNQIKMLTMYQENMMAQEEKVLQTSLQGIHMMMKKEDYQKYSRGVVCHESTAEVCHEVCDRC